MALSSKERQERWLKKNRAVFNLRRRNARKRKKNLSVPVLADSPVRHSGTTTVDEAQESTIPSLGSDSRGAQTSPNSKIEELRALVAAESAKPPVPLPAKLRIYRNDFGVVITEEQYNVLQGLKADAIKGGYVLDDN